MSEEVLFFYWCSSCSYIFQLTWLVRFGWQLADFHCCYSELVILISWMNIVGGCTTLCEHYFCCSTALYTRYIIWHSSVTQCWLCQNLLLLRSRLLYISNMHIKTNFDFFFVINLTLKLFVQKNQSSYKYLFNRGKMAPWKKKLKLVVVPIITWGKLLLISAQTYSNSNLFIANII